MNIEIHLKPPRRGGDTTIREDSFALCENFYARPQTFSFYLKPPRRGGNGGNVTLHLIWEDSSVVMEKPVVRQYYTLSFWGSAEESHTSLTDLSLSFVGASDTRFIHCPRFGQDQTLQMRL